MSVEIEKEPVEKEITYEQFLLEWENRMMILKDLAQQFFDGYQHTIRQLNELQEIMTMAQANASEGLIVHYFVSEDGLGTGSEAPNRKKEMGFR